MEERVRCEDTVNSPLGNEFNLCNCVINEAMKKMAGVRRRSDKMLLDELLYDEVSVM